MAYFFLFQPSIFVRKFLEGIAIQPRSRWKVSIDLPILKKNNMNGLKTITLRYFFWSIERIKEKKKKRKEWKLKHFAGSVAFNHDMTRYSSGDKALVDVVTNFLKSSTKSHACRTVILHTWNFKFSLLIAKN